MQTLDREHISSINMDIVRGLAEIFSMHPVEYMPWLIECCNYSESSKTLFFLVMMQSFILQKNGTLFLSFPFLKCSSTSPATLGLDIHKRSMLLVFRCFHDA